MTSRIRCSKCEAESYYDGKTKIYCPTCFAQLEAELAGMKLMEAEAAQFTEGMELVPEGTQAENERLQKIEKVCQWLFEKEDYVAKYIKVDGEGDTWQIPESIGLALMEALGGEG